MKNDYDIIKKKYGERMAKACRRLFPTIMDVKGALPTFLLSKFYPHSYLYQDIVENKEDSFKRFVYNFFDLDYEHVDTSKSAKELLSEAGYDLYECHTNEDIMKFKKYYALDEEICTFGDPDRIKNNYIFFAVKKDVDNIKREDFVKPYREDLYGTSVISIQFEKGNYNPVSIKNRYNHKVLIPDATFSNNLDNIITGLTCAFENDYNLNITTEKNDYLNDDYLKLENYFLASDGRYYKYNYKINDIYYCPNNIIVDHGKVLKADGSRYKLMDYFLLDYHEKKITLYDDTLYDSFCNQNISKIDVQRDKNIDNIIFTITDDKNNNTILCVDDNSRIVGVVNNDILKIEDNYMSNNLYTKYASFSNCKSVGHYFMSDNEIMSRINFDNCEFFGDMFLSSNNGITNISFKKAKKICNMFFQYNQVARIIDLPLVESIGTDAFYLNSEAKELNIENAEYIGDNFFFSNDYIDPYIPKLKNYINGAFGSRMDVTNKLIEVINNNARKINEVVSSKNEEVTGSRRK